MGETKRSVRRTERHENTKKAISGGLKNILVEIPLMVKQEKRSYDTTLYFQGKEDSAGIESFIFHVPLCSVYVVGEAIEGDVFKRWK